MAKNSAFFNKATDESVLVSNMDAEVPNYNTMATPSAPPIGDEPPNYFDISVVPNNAILHYNEVTPYTVPSTAMTERNSKGVLSFDPLIDHNPDQLWLYFMTYLNEKPQFQVNLHGSYTETYTTTETYTDSDGNTQTRYVDQTRDVTEFCFSVDLTPYICHQWWRVAVIPSNEIIKTGEIVSLRDAIEQYTRSERQIKEIILTKQLGGWNLDDLKSKLLALVRSTGYRNNVSITYNTENYQIVARSSSKLSAFANSTATRILCCVTCLCIIFAPIYCCLKSLGSTRDKIVAEYTMMKTPDIFLQLNSHAITDSVINRSSQSFIARYD